MSLYDEIKIRIAELEATPKFLPLGGHIHESYLLNKKCQTCDDLEEKRNYIKAIPFILRELKELIKND